ncbi:MAG: AAA family ATPase [Candidatus Aenigmarchaeota archaeon]|nr:AAA family ATPase [Candidatus Aenigmarchaeota archaeon]
MRLMFYSKGMAHFLNRACNLPLGWKKDLHVPRFVFAASEEEIAAFVSGYFDGDGTVSVGNGYPTPRLYSIHRPFLEEMRSLLLQLNIPSQVVTWKTPWNSLFALTIMGHDGRSQFYQKVFPHSNRVRKGTLSKKEEGEDLIPVASLLKRIKADLGIRYGKDIKENSIEPYLSGRKELTRRKVREIVGLLEKKGSHPALTRLRTLLHADLRFQRITRMEKKGPATLYDFGVHHHANFIGGWNLSLLHNSKWYGQSEANLRKIFKEAEKNAPSIVFIDEIDAIAPNRSEVTGEVERRVVSQLLTLLDGLKSRGKVIVIAATNRPNALDPALRRGGRFDREIEIGVPDQIGRKEVLQIHTRNMPLEKDVDVNKIASITYGFVGADLEALCKEAAMSALRRILPGLSWKKTKEIPADVFEKLKVSGQDFANAQRMVEPSAMREIMVEIPNVKWDDVGGLDYVKAQLKEAVEWPLSHPEAFQRIGIQPPRGILLYGPPGTGKTMLAKAVASESQANFISIRGPELLSKWVGESEKHVRDIFRKAKQVAPAIIFFDEIDSITHRRGDELGSRVTENVVSTILTEMSGLEDLHNVVVIAATNRPDIIDPALLRPGRFDRQILVTAPDAAARRDILRIHTRDMPLEAGEKVKIKLGRVRKKAVAEAAGAEDPREDLLGYLVEKTEGYSGADLEALCREAGMFALREELGAKVVTREHFEQALKEITPSITADMLQFYGKVTEAIKAEAAKPPKGFSYVG